MRRWLPWATGAVVLGGLIWSFLYLKDLHPLGALGSRLGGNELEGVAIRFKNAKLVGRSGGKKVWAFEAKTIDVSKDRRLATFKGITRGWLFQDDAVVASLSADNVKYNTYTRNVSAPGSAEFRLKDGPAFKVHDVYWNAAKSKLVCKGGVKAELAGSTMNGDSLIANLANKEVTIYRVRGQIRLSE